MSDIWSPVANKVCKISCVSQHYQVTENKFEEEGSLTCSAYCDVQIGQIFQIVNLNQI